MEDEGVEEGKGGKGSHGQRQRQPSPRASSSQSCPLVFAPAAAGRPASEVAAVAVAGRVAVANGRDALRAALRAAHGRGQSLPGPCRKSARAASNVEKQIALDRAKHNPTITNHPNWPASWSRARSNAKRGATTTPRRRGYLREGVDDAGAAAAGEARLLGRGRRRVVAREVGRDARVGEGAGRALRAELLVHRHHHLRGRNRLNALACEWMGGWRRRAGPGEDGRGEPVCSTW